MGLLDSLSSSNGGGLLDFLKSLQVQGLALSPDMQPANFNAAQGYQSVAAQPGPMQANAQMIPQHPPPVIQAQPIAQAAPQPSLPSGPGFGERLGSSLQSFANSHGLLPAIANGLSGLITGHRADPTGMALEQQAQTANYTARALIQKGVDPQMAIAAVQPGNTEMLKQLVDQNFGPAQFTSAGSGYILNNKKGTVEKAFEPDDKTPNSVLEYQYYLKGLPKGAQPMDYATFSTAKARAGATNISNNIDMNSGQTYDKQLAEGLGKSHAALANGVEDAQSRARDIAAMQGAVDAIQKSGGTTGGLAPAQRLELLKSINAGAAALGIEKPFSEADISDKEFLTKFNRSMAGAQAKNSVGNRVTNFEMSNFLKANPGLDMTVTGNQRLLGIQAQIEQRNIAVGNAIRDATAQAISRGEKINPVTVQKIITDYDQAHHIHEPTTGQDLTQSVALPEFQSQGTNPALAAQHETNMKKIRRYNPQTGKLE